MSNFEVPLYCAFIALVLLVCSVVYWLNCTEKKRALGLFDGAFQGACYGTCGANDKVKQSLLQGKLKESVQGMNQGMSEGYCLIILRATGAFFMYFDHAVEAQIYL